MNYFHLIEGVGALIRFYNAERFYSVNKVKVHKAVLFKIIQGFLEENGETILPNSTRELFDGDKQLANAFCKERRKR